MNFLINLLPEALFLLLINILINFIFVKYSLVNFFKNLFNNGFFLSILLCLHIYIYVHIHHIPH